MNTQMRGPNAGRGRPVLPVARALAEQTFRFADIPAVRRAAAAFGARAGMGMAKLSDFVQAVSEAAACAVAQAVHGQAAAVDDGEPRVLRGVR